MWQNRRCNREILFPFPWIGKKNSVCHSTSIRSVHCLIVKFPCILTLTLCASYRHTTDLCTFASFIYISSSCLWLACHSCFLVVSCDNLNDNFLSNSDFENRLFNNDVSNTIDNSIQCPEGKWKMEEKFHFEGKWTCSYCNKKNRQRNSKKKATTRRMTCTRTVKLFVWVVGKFWTGCA